MKKMFFFASLLVIADSAMAVAPTSELTVSGTVKTPSCTLSVDELGEYNFGIIPTTSVGAAETSLEPKSLTYIITCDAETYLTFKTVDNRAASVTAPAATKFGLGKNGDGNVGYYTGKVKNAMVDGSTAKLMQSGSTSFAVYDVVDLTTSTSLVTGWAKQHSVLQSGKVFTADVEITPYLSKLTDFGALVSDVSLDGSATMNFAFAI